MKRAILAGLVALMVAGQAFAQSQFCAGWEAGWRSAFENRRMLVALTPLCPLPRLGGDSYEAGFERGLTTALGYIAQHGR